MRLVVRVKTNLENLPAEFATGACANVYAFVAVRRFEQRGTVDDQIVRRDSVAFPYGFEAVIERLIGIVDYRRPRRPGRSQISEQFEIDGSAERYFL